MIEKSTTIEIIDAHYKKYVETVRELFIEYAGILDADLCFQGFEQELEELPGKYSPPDGCILLALCDGKPAGCVALRKFSEGVSEMKRLYVRPEFRGKKLGRLLTDGIIKKAREIGYNSMKLDTLESLKEALSLYESMGFQRIEPYRFNPLEGAVYMELKF